MDRDVIVVGAGLAGLTAARALADAGLDVEVWEARDRVGGRTLSRRIDGGIIDLGAQWLGPEQRRMHALADRFGLERFPTHASGRSLVVDGDVVHSYGGTVPLLGPVQLARMAAALVQFRTLSTAVGAGRSVRDRPLDETLTTTTGTGSARRVVDAAIRVIFGEEPSGLSTAWVAAYAAAAGGDLLDLAAIEGGAQQTRLAGGTQAFSSGLAEGLRVTLQRPLARLRRDVWGVTATAADGTTCRARRAVLALPPTLVDDVVHEPALPSTRTAATTQFVMGSTTKAFAFYDEPFWRADGLRGEAVLTDGPVQVVFDNTQHDGAAPSLLCFVTGDAARAAADRPDAELAEAVRTALGRAFGPRAAQPRQLVQHHWQRETWTRGCPTANAPQRGDAGVVAVLARPVGRVHFAGTETAATWRGYMEGAVASGERAAAEVVRAG